MKIVQPRTPEEWKQAVDLAEFFLHVHAAKCYGLVEGGPAVNAERCRAILQQGARRGVRPDSIDNLCERFGEFFAAAGQKETAR